MHQIKVAFMVMALVGLTQSVMAQSQGGSAEAAAPDVPATISMPMDSSTTILKKGFFDFYSENSYYYDYDFVTDSRLRYYLPVTELGSVGVSAYIGANIQYQSPGASEKYYDNTFNPNVGLQFQFVPGVKLNAQVGYRTVTGMNDEPRQTTWDPRLVFSAGDILMWGMTKNFTEGYLESAFVPRLDRTPVTLAWIKQGYRWFPHAKLSLDAYGEGYQRVSNSEDLGPTMTEWRAGGRSTWTEKAWNVSALIYHPFPKHVSSGEIEGLVTLGGQF
ncbi:hypothetical protein [Bdellovibrio sp. KM01]|uniref:hypothetical protein n=1 Tax=Bdellovibrio sp. KM01 TaxID=2748865 RepID=UPI0015E9110F|nr:hypothetical protein [Bdellovibrio sp. KM01]QLY27015.1 hypothetical protein HW988_08490 [Bdellovibrio sp. KM01]